jgi:signal transduction histidine kinase
LVDAARDVHQVIFFGNEAITISGLTAAPVLGAKFELMRVFQNLFKNSLEAGAKGVSVTFARREQRIEVAIADNGGGMAPESVRRALQGGFTSKTGGTGLGLGICRHLVTAHGGTFHFESRPGAGTTVRLSFPAAPPA